MKISLITLGIIAIIGAVGGFTGYAYRCIGTDDDGEKVKFSLKISAFMTIGGIAVAFITGFICQDMGVSLELTYALVGCAAISSKELIALIPVLMKKNIRKIGK